MCAVGQARNLDTGWLGISYIHAAHRRRRETNLSLKCGCMDKDYEEGSAQQLHSYIVWRTIPLVGSAALNQAATSWSIFERDGNAAKISAGDNSEGGLNTISMAFIESTATGAEDLLQRFSMPLFNSR